MNTSVIQVDPPAHKPWWREHISPYGAQRKTEACGFEPSMMASIGARVPLHAMRRQNSAFRMAWSIEGK
jgi:hypothetical protein